MVGPICAKLALIFSGCITLENAVNAEMDGVEEGVLTGVAPETEKLPQSEAAETGTESEETPAESTGAAGESGEGHTDVSLVEHFAELEMGVENQELDDIESCVHLEKEEQEEKPEKPLKADKRKKKEKKKSAGKR